MKDVASMTQTERMAESYALLLQFEQTDLFDMDYQEVDGVIVGPYWDDSIDDASVERLSLLGWRINVVPTRPSSSSYPIKRYFILDRASMK